MRDHFHMYVTPPWLRTFDIYARVSVRHLDHASLLRGFFSLTLHPSVQFSHSVVSDSLWPMNRSMPGLPVHYQLPEFTQTHVHRVGDAIQPSHPLSSPSPPAPNPSQHQGLLQLFAWGSQSIGVSASASVLPMNTQDWSPLGWTGWIFL